MGVEFDAAIDTRGADGVVMDNITIGDNTGRIVIYAGHVMQYTGVARTATFASNMGTPVDLATATYDNAAARLTAYIGYILNPVVGAGKNITLTPNDTVLVSTVSAISLYRASGLAPTVSQTGTNTNSISLTGAAGGMLASAHYENKTTADAQGAGETSRWVEEFDSGDNPRDTGARGSTKVADGSSQAMARAGAVDVLLACAVNQAGFIAGGSGVFIFSKTQSFYDELKRGLVPSWDLRRRYREAYA